MITQRRNKKQPTCAKEKKVQVKNRQAAGGRAVSPGHGRVHGPGLTRPAGHLPSGDPGRGCSAHPRMAAGQAVSAAFALSFLGSGFFSASC